MGIILLFLLSFPLSDFDSGFSATSAIVLSSSRTSSEMPLAYLVMELTRLPAFSVLEVASDSLEYSSELISLSFFRTVMTMYEVEVPFSFFAVRDTV